MRGYRWGRARRRAPAARSRRRRRCLGTIAIRDRTPARDRNGRRRPPRAWSVRRSLGTRSAARSAAKLLDIATAAGYRFLIAAGDSAMAALDQAPTFELSGLVCLSPRIPSDLAPPRHHAFQAVARRIDGWNDLRDARRLATVSGGLGRRDLSYPVAGKERSSWLLRGSSRLIEEIGSFLRDCQRRPALATLPTDRSRPESPSAPRGHPLFPVSDGPGTTAGLFWAGQAGGLVPG